MIPFRLAILSLMFCAFELGAAAAQESATVEATLTFAGQTHKLDHVLIVRAGNEEGMDASGPRLRIYLSDAEIPLRLAGGATDLGAKGYAQQAGLSAVVVFADPAGKDRGAQLSLLNAAGTQQPGFATASDTNALSEFQVAAEHASGAITFQGGQIGLTAKFSAPITANPITADLTGKAALESPPVQALAAYDAALAKADMAALAKCTTALRLKQIQAFHDQAGEKAFRQAVKSETGGPPLAQTVKRVIVRGESASVVLKGGEVAELVQENGAWKMN